MKNGEKKNVSVSFCFRRTTVVHSVLRPVDRAGGRAVAAGVAAAAVVTVVVVVVVVAAAGVPVVASRPLPIPRTRRIFHSGPGVYPSP